MDDFVWILTELNNAKLIKCICEVFYSSGVSRGCKSRAWAAGLAVDSLNVNSFIQNIFRVQLHSQHKGNITSQSPEVQTNNKLALVTKIQ